MIKKIAAVLLAITIVLTLGACSSTDNDSSEDMNKDVTEAVAIEKEVPEVTTEEEPIEKKTTEKITEEELEPDLTTDEGKTAWTEKYFTDKIKSFGTLDRVEINEDAGKGEGYIMLVYCSFDMENQPDTAKNTISMLAEDMASRVGKDLKDVNELCVFWEVPYLETNAKTQFERKGNGMAFGDQVFNF